MHSIKSLLGGKPVTWISKGWIYRITDSHSISSYIPFNDAEDKYEFFVHRKKETSDNFFERIILPDLTDTVVQAIETRNCKQKRR